MPTLPATDGLPVWAQVLVSILICIATLAVALKGYFPKTAPAQAADAPVSTVGLAAVLGDIGTNRHNTEAVVQLSANVLALTNAVNEATHHTRNEVEIFREMCRALSDLKDELERQGRDAIRWDKRNEARRAE